MIPLIAIVGIVSAAIGAYTMVQGIKNNNKKQVMMGMVGIFGGAAAAGGAFTSAGAAAGAAAPVAEGGSVAGGFLAGEAGTVGGASNFASLGGTAGEGVTGLKGMTGEAARDSLFTSASQPASAAPSALQSAGGTQTAVEGLTNLSGSVAKQSAGLGTNLKEGFKSGMGFLTDNPELTKLGGSLFKSVMDNQTANKNRDAQMGYYDKLKQDADAERARRGVQVSAPIFNAGVAKSG